MRPLPLLLGVVAVTSVSHASAWARVSHAPYSSYFDEYTKRLAMSPAAGTVSAASAALVVVDMQADFVGEFAYTDDAVAAGESPCSAYFTSVGSPKTIACFGVREGNVTSAAIEGLLSKVRFATVVASMDDHSPDHCSFAAAADQAVTAGAPTGCGASLATCDASAFHGCMGTRAAQAKAGAGAALTGPFPPHCVRGRAGTVIYEPLRAALSEYTAGGGAAHVAVKGLDLSTDSFGVLPYSETSWSFYHKAGLFGPTDPAPAALIRSMLTWEKHMNTSTGAASYTTPFGSGYAQPPPFSTDGGAGELHKDTAADIIGASKASAVLVTGLALDWCVLDTALNARALMPEKKVYIVLDAARPAFLPAGPAVAPYLKANNETQCYGAEGGCWLHDPVDVAKVLKQAGVEVIMSSQVTA